MYTGQVFLLHSTSILRLSIVNIEGSRADLFSDHNFPGSLDAKREPNMRAELIADCCMARLHARLARAATVASFPSVVTAVSAGPRGGCTHILLDRLFSKSYRIVHNHVHVHMLQDFPCDGQIGRTDSIYKAMEISEDICGGPSTFASLESKDATSEASFT